MFENVTKKYDLIVSNPPYIDERDYRSLQPEIINYEPKIALVAAENGLKIYRQVIEDSHNYLNNNGYLAFEIGHNQAESIIKLGELNYLQLVLRKKDLSGFDRILIFQK